MDHGGVNIEKAENSFNELSRQLTQGTVVDDRDHGDETRVPTSIGKRPTEDVEKGGVDQEQPFDLREYLSSSNDANERAGIKHKHVGVVWENFHVDVLGGSDFKVSVTTTLVLLWLLNLPIGETVVCANLRRSVS